MRYVLSHAFRWVIALIIIGVIVAFVVVNVIGYYEAPPETMPCPSSHCETYYDNDGRCWCECSDDGGLTIEVIPCDECEP